MLCEKVMRRETPFMTLKQTLLTLIHQALIIENKMGGFVKMFEYQPSLGLNQEKKNICVCLD